MLLLFSDLPMSMSSPQKGGPEGCGGLFPVLSQRILLFSGTKVEVPERISNAATIGQARQADRQTS
jgi:hypothetical protein